MNKMYTKEDMSFEGISMQEGNKSSTLKLLGFMVVTAIVLGLLIFTAGSFFSDKPEKGQSDIPGITILPTSSEKDPTSTPVPTRGVTPSVTVRATGKLSVTTSQKTPTPSITGSTKKIALSVEVLNGSGVKGAAGKMSSALTNAGYTTSTGNADSFTYTGVTVNIKKSKAQLLDTLKKDLSANNYLVTKTSTNLEESSLTDAVIILGAE